MSEIEKRLQKIQDQIRISATQVGRDPSEIKIIAVTKTVSVQQIRDAQLAGVKEIGENRVQETLDKYQTLGRSLKWHLIGHLQTNKVKKALTVFDLIHSVDSLNLAQEIQKEAEKLKKTVPILVQVNTSEEESKFGLHPDQVKPLVSQMADLRNLKIQGLMTMGPMTQNPDQSRQCFRRLKELSERLKSLPNDNVEMKFLSMGMSGDYPIAIEEGANLLRIGTALFGERLQG